MNSRQNLMSIEHPTYADLISPYIRMYRPEPLLPYFEELASRKDIRTDWESFFWLYYICLLLGIGQRDKAMRILDEYVSGTNGLAGIFRFPAISALALEMGLADETIRKTASVFERLEEAERKSTFANMVRGRRVAIVGNSQSEIGKKSGAAIDAHDIVIRFNNYMLDGFEEDYGARTDVWIRGFGFVDVDDRLDKETFSYSGISGDYHYHPICSREQAEIMHRDVVVRGLSCSYFDPWGYRRMHRTFSGEPTTGLVTIYSCLRFGATSVDCFGFSFQETKLSLSHYFYQREDKSMYRGLANVHDLSGEQLYLMRLTRDLRWTKGHIPYFIRKFLGPGEIWKRFNPKLKTRA